jgi:hypothetical protein
MMRASLLPPRAVSDARLGAILAGAAVSAAEAGNERAIVPIVIAKSAVPINRRFSWGSPVSRFQKAVVYDGRTHSVVFIEDP